MVGAGIVQDVRYALRVLRHEPGYAIVAALAIALGIAATTTLYSVTYSVLIKPLPWPEADRLVRLEERRGGRSGRVPWTITNGTYLAWRESSTVEAIGGWMSMSGTFEAGGEPERVRFSRLTPSIFTVLHATPLAGRPFEAADAANRQADTVILSHGFWQRRFGGAPDVIGRGVRIDSQPYTIIGVMPQSFAFPDRETEGWVPAHIAQLHEGDRISLQIFGALARMRPGVTPDQVGAEGTGVARTVRDPGSAALALFGSSEPPTISATPALEVVTAEVRPAIRVLLAAVLLLFATAVASVATIQLARALRRRRESTIRAALGASQSRLARQWLVESLVIGSAGGALGVGVAALIIAGLPAVLPADFPRLAEITLEWRVALGSTLTTLVAVAICGWIPTLQTRRLDLARGLADDNQAPVGGALRTPTARLRGAIMVGQVAVACVLLIGAGLLARSLQSLINVDRGYDPGNLLTARVPTQPGTTYEQSGAMLRMVTERLAALPGVTHASFGNALPLVSAGGLNGFTVKLPRDPSTLTKVQTLHRTVDPGYFSAMGLRLRAGRLLSDTDSETSQPALVVNRSFADQYLGSDPVGQRITLSLYRKVEWEIVGVVDDMKQGGLQTAGFVTTADAAQPEMFTSYRQMWQVRPENVFFLVRTTRDPAALAPQLRAILRELAPTLVLDSVMSMDDRLMSSLSKPRAYALVLGGVAVFALAIAAVGLFCVLSYSVAQRSREIGVRTALGAQTRTIVMMVLRSGMSIVVVGLAVGVGASAILVRSLSTIVYGISPYDPLTFAAVPVVLALVAALACIAPARRAAKIDPLRALRQG